MKIRKNPFVVEKSRTIFRVSEMSLAWTIALSKKPTNCSMSPKFTSMSIEDIAYFEVNQVEMAKVPRKVGEFEGENQRNAILFTRAI